MCQTFQRNTKVQYEMKVTALSVLQECENHTFFPLDKNEKQKYKKH